MGLPIKWETSTSSGVTSSAICKLEPMTILRLKSILFLSAAHTAVDSPALPIIETMIMPTKVSERPRFLQTDSTEPANNSLSMTTKMVATANIRTPLVRLQAAGFSGPDSREAAFCPANNSLWVTSENVSQSP